MGTSTKKNVVTGIVAALNLAYWLAPGKVAYLVGQQRDVLLYRYSEGRLSGQLVALAVSIVGLYLFRARNRQSRRERAFKVIAVGVGLVVGLVILDSGYRLLRNPRYAKTAEVYHRPANQQLTGVYRDLPKARFSYPNAAPGYPEVTYTLTTDGQGFRNRNDKGRHQVVVLGDSFVEGSKVSDEGNWPQLYATRSGRSVYNLGMSGTDPAGYVQTMKQYGSIHRPELVLCTIYEGNDFRGSGELVDRVKERETWGRQTERYFKNSPIRIALQNAMTQALAFENHGPFGLDAASPAMTGVAWLPIAVPEGAQARYYSFPIKMLTTHLEDRQKFEQSAGCRTVFLALTELQGLCKESGARLVILYAPDQAHAVLPLVRSRLKAAGLRAFLALRVNDLPPATETEEMLFRNLEVQEQTIAEYCRRQGIEFQSLTPDLRAAMLHGEQAYYTYDEHWTPTGHRVVSATVYRYLQTAAPQ